MRLSDRLARAESTLLQIHEAMRRGEDERGEDLNDELTALAYDLSGPQLELVNGLSADLYSIGGEESRFPASALGIGSEGPDIALKRALTDNDWRSVLRTLRSHDLHLAEDRRAYLRASGYRALGLFAASNRFFRLANDLAPTNTAYPYLYLSSLIEQAAPEAMSLARSITANEGQTWSALALAYWVQITNPLGRGGEVDRELVIEAAERVGRMTTNETILKEEPAVASATLVRLGFWHELLDQHDLARSRYLDATLVDPDNEEAPLFLRSPFEAARLGARAESDDAKRAEQAVNRRVKRESALALAA